MNESPLKMILTRIFWRSCSTIPQYRMFLSQDLDLFARSIFLFGQEGFSSMLRRTALFIMNEGGVVKKMENLGEQELPHRMRAHHEWNTHGR